ncbi:MAG: UbiA-like polyprenyltransferase [Thermoplasmata archaeon]
MQKFGLFFKFIKIEHTIFDLPFAYMGMIMYGKFSILTVLLITIAGISARTAGMVMNRIEDYNLDKINPRTSKRELVTGEISFKEAYFILILSSIIFELSAIFLNLLSAIFAPLLLLFFYIYPKTKKLPIISHIFLGFIIGIISIAGYIGASGIIPNVMDVYFLAIFLTFWIGGFDIIYQNQDRDFDKYVGIKSIPVIFNGKILIPLTIFYFISLIFLFLISFKSIFMIISFIIVAILLFIKFPFLKSWNVDKLFYFDIPVPFLILISLLI